MASEPVEMVRCPAGDQAEALEVFCWRLSSRQRTEMANRLQNEAKQGDLDLSHIWVARKSGLIVGVVLAQVYVGRTAAVWPPEVSPERLAGGLIWKSARNRVAAGLVRHAVGELGHAGIRVVQALLEWPVKAQQAADLKRGGMPHVTDLIYLSRPSADSGTPTRLATAALAWDTYRPETDAEFRRVLEATYQASLDMPELVGTRSLDDILASHRATGHFAAKLWQIGHVPGEPGAAAVLLMLDRPDRDAIEVAYLGLTPDARGRGLGRSTVQHAIEVARPLRSRVELAVDSRNTPARRLYLKTEFQPYESRSVHLAVFRDQSPEGTPRGGC